MRYTRKNWRRGTGSVVPPHLLRSARMVLAVLAAFAALVFVFPAIFMPPELPANPMVTAEQIQLEWHFRASSQALELIPRQRVGILVQMAVVLGILLLAFPGRGPEHHILWRPAMATVSVPGIADGVRPLVLSGLDVAFRLTRAPAEAAEATGSGGS